MVMNKRGILVLVVFSLFVTSIFLSLNFVSAQEDDNVFSIFTNEDGGVRIFFHDKFGSGSKEIIVSIIVTLILFAGLYDILELVSIFQLQWVKYIMAGGFTLIAVMWGWPIKFTNFLGGAVAALGPVAIVLEIVIAIAIFIGLIVGNGWIAKFAAKRKAQAAYIKASESAGEAAAAIHGLKEIEKELKKK